MACLWGRCVNIINNYLCVIVLVYFFVKLRWCFKERQIFLHFFILQKVWLLSTKLNLIWTLVIMLKYVLLYFMRGENNVAIKKRKKKNEGKCLLTPWIIIIYVKIIPAIFCINDFLLHETSRPFFNVCCFPIA